MHKLIVFVALFGTALAGDLQQGGGVAYGAPAVATSYGAPGGGAVLKSSGPAGYSHQVPAAAIRNVETVGVTKTITPVVTKTTTHQTHSEPALSVGHVQGYSQSSQGPAQVAPVQYNTQYTQYLNPTVGVNGPVTYAGPAVGPAGYALSAGGGGGGAVAVGGGAVGVGYAAPAAYAAPAQQFAYAAPAAQYAYAAPAAQVAYAAPAQFASYAAPAVQVQSYAAPAVGYSGISGYAAQPQFLSAGVALPAEIQGGSYGGAQFLSDAGQVQAAYAAPATSYGAPSAGYGKR